MTEETLTISYALYDQLKEFVSNAAMEPAEDDYSTIDSHQLWLDAKDRAQTICDSQGWEYEDHNEDTDEDEEDLFTCAQCDRKRPGKHISSCYGCYILKHDDSYCNDGCLEEHLKLSPACVAIYDKAGAIEWEERS